MKDAAIAVAVVVVIVVVVVYVLLLIAGIVEQKVKHVGSDYRPLAVNAPPQREWEWSCTVNGCLRVSMDDG